MRFHYLLLGLAGLILTLVPGAALAQEGKPVITLRMVPGDYSNTLVPGKDNTFSLLVSNLGDTQLTNIRLSTFAPKDWMVEFIPPNINFVEARGFETITMNVRPPESLEKRDYAISVVAESTETRAIIDFWFRIETGISIWLWVGIAVGVVVVAAFVFIFLRLGKQ